MTKKKIIKELVILVMLLVVSFLTNDIRITFFGVTQFEFIGSILGIYIFLRSLIDLIIIVVKYKKRGQFRDYSGTNTKIYFENSIYGHLTIIFFVLIFSNTLAIASVVLFLIFGILWLLSKISILMNEKNSIRTREKINSDEVNHLEECGSIEEDLYNFIYVDFYSDFGFSFFKILSDNTFGILNNYNNQDEIVLLDKLNKSNYLFLVPRSLFFGDVNLLCGVFNSYLKRLEVKCRINPEDILSKDNENLTKRRKSYRNTLTNDLEIIDKILKKNKFRVISIGVDDSLEMYLCLSVVSNNVYHKIENLSKKSLRK